MFKRLGIVILAAGGISVSALRGQPIEVLAGRIVDAETGDPLVGATVFVLPSGEGAASDSNGEFRLVTKEPVDSLVARFIGYEPARLAADAVRENRLVELSQTTLLYREVTVTAKRYPAAAGDLPSPVDLIPLTSPAVATMQNIGEAIRHAQSLYLKDYGGLSGLKTVTLRGASEGQVLVLVDGFRLNNPQGGWVDFNMLPLIGVESIEILRGGASAQYGSEAMGGIIHLRTSPAPDRFTPRAEYTLGSYGTGVARFSLGHRFGKFSATAAFNALRTDGDYPVDSNSSSTLQDNRLEREDLYVRGDLELSANLKVAAFHTNGHSDREVAGALLFPTPGANQTDNNRMTAFMVSARRGDWLDLSLRTNVQRLAQDYANPDPLFPVTSRHQVDSRELILHNRSRVAKFELLYGIEFAHHTINSTDIGHAVRDQRSAFAQFEWRMTRVRHGLINRLAILPAIRVDHFSDAGTQTTPKIGVVWKWEKQASLSLHASIGRSFRVPTMNDLFWPDTPYVSGNPDLQPEKGTQYDAGVLLQVPETLGNWKMGMDVFSTRITNLISWIPDENFRFSPQNISRARITGFEPSLSWRAAGDRLSARISFTKLSARDDGDDPATRGKKLLYRPEQKLDAEVSARVLGITIGARYQMVSERFARQDNSFSLPGYRLTDLFGSHEFSLGQGFRARLAGAVNNVFDKRIQMIEGYPTPGREYRLTLGVGR